jgi:hypothetical protein
MKSVSVPDGKRRWPLAFVVSEKKYAGIIFMSPVLGLMAFLHLVFFQIQEVSAIKLMDSWPLFLGLYACAFFFIWVGIASEVSNRYETAESVATYTARLQASELSKGVYAYVHANGDASLVLLGTRATDVAPAGQLNCTLMNNSSFYAGMPATEWRGGYWVRLHTFE